MRLFEAIIAANHRALQGDRGAGLHLADYEGELPVVALTCIDPRLNRLFPGVMGLPAESFIWLRNAGNIITGPLSSTMRSLALSCAVKGGREIAIIGHTDCQVRHISVAELSDRLDKLGVNRLQLPLNLGEYFGVFANERQNVIQAVDVVRHSPLIGPRIPVHGLMVDIATGDLEWVVNGYEGLQQPQAQASSLGVKMPEIGGVISNLADRIGADLGDLKFPDAKIGEAASGVAAEAKNWFSQLKVVPPAQLAPTPSPPPVPAPPAVPRPIPVPPPIRMRPGRR
ncbi:MAG: carbonic anhydrase [Limisphaerales bacterium]